MAKPSDGEKDLVLMLGQLIGFIVQKHSISEWQVLVLIEEHCNKQRYIVEAAGLDKEK